MEGFAWGREWEDAFAILLTNVLAQSKQHVPDDLQAQKRLPIVSPGLLCARQGLQNSEKRFLTSPSV